MSHARTMIAWVDGERFVFRDDQVDHALEIGSQADSTDEAYDRLVEYGRSIS